MSKYSYDFELNNLDSNNKKSNDSYNDLNDFNLNDFYKCVKLNKLKKSMSDNSLINNASTDNALSDNGNLNDELSKNMLTYKRSRLLNKLGSYKSIYSKKMGIVEYLLHSYVILFTPSPVTVYNYEAIFKNLNSESDEFWKALRTLTRVQLNIENYPNQVANYVTLLLDSKEDNESDDNEQNSDTKKLDSHFTWLCKCCINVTDSKNQNTNDDTTPKGSNEQQYNEDSNDLKSNKRKNLSNQLMLNNIFNKNFDLSSDVLYEALRQRGNRFVQRSLYNNVKNVGSLCSRGINPNVTAKLTETNARMKRFMDIIQQSSLDSSDPNSYNNYYDLYGDERRYSSRRSMVLRKKYN